MHGEAGKGDRQRPRNISQREWELRYDLAFGKITREEFDREMLKQPKKIISTCPICGGDMLGDGYKVVRRCENVDLDVECPLGVEPDSGPIYCTGENDD